MSLTIQEDSLFCNDSSCVLDISLTFTNASKENVLVYALDGGLRLAPFDLSELCDKRSTGTSILIGLYYPNGKQARPTIEIAHPHGQRKVTREVLDSVLYQARVDFLKSGIVLKSGESETYIKEFSLKRFMLHKGLYYLKAAYYSGDKTLEILDVDKIKKSKAKLFQGCTFSQNIPLTITR
ncbi:MAG TPA: hypothetical protein VIN08_01340 [Ohtaekwangia sp.]|uniref:hypothetical protein n=1 Tax=Ohtaekwangia sp. TaxID=2066019 RepID=UPI002F944ECB